LFLNWVMVGTAALLAVVAFERARRISKRLKRLTESYWDLRYELGQLQARVKRLEPERQEQTTTSPASQPGAFIPLSSLKR
jgi:hypothetical protein